MKLRFEVNPPAITDPNWIIRDNEATGDIVVRISKDYPQSEHFARLICNVANNFPTMPPEAPKV